MKTACWLSFGLLWCILLITLFVKLIGVVQEYRPCGVDAERASNFYFWDSTNRF